MRTFKTLCMLLLIAAVASPIAAQNKHSANTPDGTVPSGPAPTLVIESFTHDFGEVKAGTPLRHTFRVKNQGKADLLINSVSPG